MCWFMVGCVGFSVYCHAGGADKCKMGCSCVYDTALDLGALVLCVEWRVGWNYVGIKCCKVFHKKRWVFEDGLCLGRVNGCVLGLG